MGFKTKWNRFWTLRNTEGGFTLVELVVVIAILAILAGVSVPLYTNYITKANEAADMVLAEGVSVAFLAACGENGVDGDNVSEASVRLSNGTVFGLSTFGMFTPVEGVTIDTITQDFNSLYTAGGVFKTEGVQSLVWDTATQSFTLSTAGAPARVTLSNGKSVTVTPEDMEKLTNSGLINLGYDGMVTIMEGVDGTGETLVSLLKSDDDYFSRLSDAYIANGLMTKDEAAEITKALRGEASIYSKDEAMARAKNALTMCAAMEIAKPTTNVDDLMAVDFGDSTVGIVKAYTSGIGGSKATAALALQYAVASNYAQQNPNDKVTVGIKVAGQTVGVEMTMEQFLNGTYKGKVWGIDVSSTVNKVAQEIKADPAMYMNTVESSANYQTYISEGQYKNDIDGMYTALGLLGNNVPKDDVNSTINVTGQGGYLEEGIESADTKEMIETILEAAKKDAASKS